MADKGRILVKQWYRSFAPGLEPQPIPENAIVEGPLEPLIPYGLQYRVKMPDGSVYPRHQSGPGATVAVTDGQRLIANREYRQESNTYLLKCCGGFAGERVEVAAEMVHIFNVLSTETHTVVGPSNYSALRGFLDQMLKREYNGWPISDHTITFVDRPIGNPNIRICSIVGIIRVSQNEIDEWQWPHHVLGSEEARTRLENREFGDENTARLVAKILAT